MSAPRSGRGHIRTHPVPCWTGFRSESSEGLYKQDTLGLAGPGPVAPSRAQSELCRG